jgi:hypothetical protein
VSEHWNRKFAVRAAPIEDRAKDLGVGVDGLEEWSMVECALVRYLLV